jgi:hypothetical protein
MFDIDVLSEGVSARAVHEEFATTADLELEHDPHPLPIAGATVLLVVDWSAETRMALQRAERLAAHGASVEVFFLWSASGDVTSADRVVAELTIVSSEAGGIELLEHVGELQRRGILTVGGCITREASGGASLSALAARGGYQAVVLGLRRTPDQSHRFRLHRFP